MTGEVVDLTGHVAVVTGGGRGIGRAHALELSARGAAVVVNDVGAAGPGGASEEPEIAERTAGEIRALGRRAIASTADVSTPDGGRKLIEHATDEFGRVDIVIHNAGIGGGAPFAELPLETVSAVLGVHLLGGVHVCQPAWRHMTAQGYGRIVLTSSSAIWGLPGKVPYCMAKSGLVGLARALKHEAELLGPWADIKVNVISPLATTRLGGDLDPIFGAGRTGPSQVAAVAAFLASPACQLNGEHLHAGAGHVARVFSGLARGWAKASEDLSAEEVLNHLESILDNSTHTEPDSVRDVLTSMASIVLGDPGEADERVARWLRQQATDLAQAASGSQTH